MALAGCAKTPATVDASGTSVQLACESGGAAFPLLDKGCVQAGDCFIAEHANGCCTEVAIGLNATSEPAFAAVEAACAAAYTCGCNVMFATAEDDRTADLAGIRVRC